MTNQPPYVLPKVWTWDAANGGQFANINRPIAGATHDEVLPRGHMVSPYYEADFGPQLTRW